MCGRGRDWFPGKGWECEIKSLLESAECYFHKVSLNFTLSWKICSGVFNVTSFRGAEMDQVLRKMEEGR